MENIPEDASDANYNQIKAPQTRIDSPAGKFNSFVYQSRKFCAAFIGAFVTLENSHYSHLDS